MHSAIVMTNAALTSGHHFSRAATARPTHAASLLGRRDVAVLFDFNGVLIDDEPIHFQAFRQVLAADGHMLRPEDYRHYLGLDDRGTFLTLLSDQGADVDPDLLDDWIASKQRLYAELTHDGAHLFPGARELIVALDRAGVALAIVSGARRTEIERALETAGLASSFPVVIAADSVARAKPDPEGYRAAFDLLAARFPGLTTGVAIEDAPAGIRAARAAGLACIGVTTSCTPRELRGADRIVDSLRQLRLVEAT